MSFFDEAGEPARAKGKGGSDSRDEKQERHSPLMQEGHRQVEPGETVGILDVPSPGVKRHSGMEDVEQKDGEDTKPVKVVSAIGCKRSHMTMIGAWYESVQGNVTSRFQEGTSGTQTAVVGWAADPGVKKSAGQQPAAAPGAVLSNARWHYQSNRMPT